MRQTRPSGTDAMGRPYGTIGEMEDDGKAARIRWPLEIEAIERRLEEANVPEDERTTLEKKLGSLRAVVKLDAERRS
jgi:hypothetical protein